MARHIHIKFGKADMPEDFGGVTRSLDREDNYCMLINSALTETKQTAAFLHEALHIYHDDFNSDRPVEVIELERREELKAIARLILEEDAGLPEDPSVIAAFQKAFKPNSAAK